MRVDREPAWVLHRRPYRDSSLLVDLLGRTHGRIAAVARGARRARSPWVGLVEPFRPLEICWTRRGELATLTGLEPAGPPAGLAGHAIWYGLYANELILKLTARDDPEPAVFEAYRRLLHQLGSSPGPEAGSGYGLTAAVSLLRFELVVLEALGVAPDLAVRGDTGAPVDPEARYRVDPVAGVLPAGGRDGVAGNVLLALAGKCEFEPGQGHDALRVMRQLIDHQLDGRKLTTPALFREVP